MLLGHHLKAGAPLLLWLLLGQAAPLDTTDHCQTSAWKSLQVHITVAVPLSALCLSCQCMVIGLEGIEFSKRN